ncbi:uncharacterized protein LOC135116307 [Scylla paramamosain]|uniref:uncharacterized protein LOC135116307 n=1 Tax=Scylla paramamosain TaxID=85552 RepID=UPI0030828E0E
MRNLVVLALTGLLAKEHTARGHTDKQRPASSSTIVALPPVVAGSVVTPHTRLTKSQRDLYLSQSQQQQQQQQQHQPAWSAGSQGAATPLARRATHTGNHREHWPPQALSTRSQFNMDKKEDGAPVTASVTTGGLLTNLHSSAFPNPASYSQYLSPASQQGRGVPPVSHSLASYQYHHPLSDPFRGDFLIKTFSATKSERQHVPASDAALRKRMGISEQRYASRVAVSNQETATSAYIHGGQDGSDPSQMEHGFGGNLVNVEPLQQSEVKTEPPVVATTSPFPAQKSSNLSERQDTADVSPSKNQPQMDSPLRSLFSSPMLLLLGVVFAASAAYMAIAMEEQGALQRLQQAQLTAAFGDQPFLEGRTKRSLLTHTHALSRIAAPKPWFSSR